MEGTLLLWKCLCITKRHSQSYRYNVGERCAYNKLLLSSKVLYNNKGPIEVQWPNKVREDSLLMPYTRLQPARCPHNNTIHNTRGAAPM